MGRLGAHWAILSEASDRGRRHADAETGSHAALSTSLAASTAVLAALKLRITSRARRQVTTDPLPGG